MSAIQHLTVSPKLPTTLGDQTHLDLPGYDIILSRVNSLYVVPAELDVSRFRDALSRVLQLFPHAAGKLRYIDRRWTIELTNPAIPLALEYKLDSSSNSFLDGDWVDQDNLSPFIDIHPIGANLNSDSIPLVCVKLTFFNNETCVGVVWHHALGDATVWFRFLHTLSQFYQGLSPVYAAPTFEKYHFPTPSDSVVAEIWPRIPHLHKTCDQGTFPAGMKSVERLTWRIDSRDLDELHSALSSKNHNAPYLSKQDCIIAYIVTVLNYTRSSPLRRVSDVVSYRNVKAPFIAGNVAGNLLMTVTADVPTDMDMAGIAAAIRNALIQCRDPDYIYKWVAVINNRRLEVFNALKAFAFPDDDDILLVNSLKPIDWCSAHFGCPDATRFHTNGVFRDSLRIHRSNPVKGVDGVWQARQSFDILIGVGAEEKPGVLGTLTHGIQYMLKNERA